MRRKARRAVQLRVAGMKQAPHRKEPLGLRANGFHTWIELKQMSRKVKVVQNELHLKAVVSDSGEVIGETTTAGNSHYERIK